ncbi:MAG: iron-sulfur cluster assembly accessory protein [Bacteriovoracaceae bacterium]|nr:iron-sulfur cluster assembly accessory protein [Bacteriovoracaceae bacterium]
MIQISEKAKIKILEILRGEPANNNGGLRLGVIGGGCSGLSYKIDLGSEADNDHIIELEEFQIYIDPKSSIYLRDVTLDFKDGLDGKGFVFVNPNATNTCGCGESFSV